MDIQRGVVVPTSELDATQRVPSSCCERMRRHDSQANSETFVVQAPGVILLALTKTNVTVGVLNTTVYEFKPAFPDILLTEP